MGLNRELNQKDIEALRQWSAMPMCYEEKIYGSEKQMAHCPNLPFDFAMEIESHPLIKANLQSCEDLIEGGYGSLTWYTATVWEYAWHETCRRCRLDIDLSVGEFADMVEKTPEVHQILGESTERGFRILQSLSTFPLETIERRPQNIHSGSFSDTFSPEAVLTERYLQFIADNFPEADGEFVPSRRHGEKNIDFRKAILSPPRMIGLLLEAYVSEYLGWHWETEAGKDWFLDMGADVDLMVNVPQLGPVGLSIKAGGNGSNRVKSAHQNRHTIAPVVDVRMRPFRGGRGRTSSMDFVPYIVELMLHLKNVELFPLPRNQTVEKSLQRAISRVQERRERSKAA